MTEHLNSFILKASFILDMTNNVCKLDLYMNSIDHMDVQKTNKTFTKIRLYSMYAISMQIEISSNQY